MLPNAGGVDARADTLVFYLSAPGSGFIMDATAGTTNRGMAGLLTVQATGPCSTATDLGGLGIVRSRGSVAVNAFSLVGLFGPSTGTTPYLLLFDDRQPGVADVVDQGQGITSGTFDVNVGRGTFSFQNVNGSISTFAYYVIGPNQFNFIDITTADGASTFFVSPD